MEVHQSSDTGLESYHTLPDEIASLGLHWCCDNISYIVERLK